MPARNSTSDPALRSRLHARLRKSRQLLLANSALLLLLLNPVTVAASAAVDVVVSGGSVFLVLDIDNDGPDMAEDCFFSLSFDTGTYTLTPTQSTATLRACTGLYFLDLFGPGQDESSDYAELTMSSSGVDGSALEPDFPALARFVGDPYEIEIIDESGDPDGPPLDVNWIRLEDPPGGDNVQAEAFICESGGPVLAVQALGGLLTVELPFEAFPNAQSPTHLGIGNLPFEQASPNAGQFSLVDVYVPVDSNMHLTIANEDTLASPIVDIDFNTLTACSELFDGPSVGIPTLRLGGLVLLGGLLLLLGFVCRSRYLQKH